MFSVDRRETKILEASIAVETMYKALRLPGSSMLTQTFKKSFENVIYHLVAVGNTNVGKSTVLNDIIGHCLLNTSERRETIFHWHIRFPLPDPHRKQE